MYLSLMPLHIAVATTSELMLSHSHNAVRIVLLGALVDTWLAKPPIPESAARDTTRAATTIKAPAKAPGKAPNGSRAKSGTSGTSGDCGDYPSGVAQFWDLLREFLLGDPVKAVRLAVLNAAVQVFIK